MNRENMRLIGSISKTYGNDGTLIVKFDTNFSEILPKQELIFIEINKTMVPFFIAHFQRRNNRSAMVRFVDYDHPFLVEEITGCKIYLPAPHDIEKPSFFSKDVTDFQVSHKTSGFIGRVKEIIEQEDNSLLIVEYNEDEVYIPINPAIIFDVNYKKKTIKVDLPEGLLTINE